MKTKRMKIRSTLILILTCIFIISTITIGFAATRVRGHYRRTKSGKVVWVKPHYRSSPDGNPYNNWSFPGNMNPYTGKIAPGNPSTYLKNYYKKRTSSYSKVTPDNIDQPANLGPKKSLQESQVFMAPNSKLKIPAEDVLTRLTIAELYYKLGEYAEAKRQFEKFLISLENSEINPGFMRKLKEEAHRYLVELNLINP